MVSRCTRAAFLWAAVLVFVGGASNSAAQEPQSFEDPNAAADGIYTECFMGMSWACLQRKALLFVDRMGKSERFPLIADGVISLVRTGPQQPDLSEESLRGLNSDSLGELMDTTIYDFFQTHVFRFELPSWLKGSSDEQQRSDNAIDFFVGDTIEEGRKKGGLGGGHHGGGGGGGGGKKGMKKMMMMMCMMAASKMMMVVPLMMGLTKMMAMKALIMGIISLTISKIMILKKLKSKQGGSSSGWSSGGSSGGWSSGGSGGGGGGWQSGGGGGGGWDRRSFSAHDLAYQGHIDNSA